MRKPQNCTRRGNMVMAIIVLVIVATLFAGICETNVSIRYAMRTKSTSAGDINSYITFTQLCAEAFQDDLEARELTTVLADVEHPNGQDLTWTLFDQTLAVFQSKLQNGESGSDGEWHHTLSDPTILVDHISIEDADTNQYMKKILEGSKVQITVSTNLSLMVEGSDDISVRNAELEPILFNVVLTKGTWRIEQTYHLSGERLVGRIDGATGSFFIDGNDAQCTLERQIVSMSNIQNLK